MLTRKEWSNEYDRTHHIKCPHCGKDYTDDTEFHIAHNTISYYGDEGVCECECNSCEKTFYVEEHVDRTWDVGIAINEKGEVGNI